MAKIDKTQDPAKDICWARADSDSKTFKIVDEANVIIPIGTWTFTLTVNLEREPADTSNEQFALTGVLVTDGTDGLVAFTPTAIQTAIDPGNYFYDIERKVSGSSIKTLLKGKVEIVQDLTK